MKRILTALIVICTTAIALAQSNVMTIDTRKPGAAVQPTMYGIFFEDINFAADGGLYAEMIKNRSFEFPQSLMGWRTFGTVTVKDDGPFDRNPHYVRLQKTSHRDKPTGIENEGFFGIATKADASYRLSLWARCPEGGSSKLRIEIVDNASMGETQTQAQCNISIEGPEWKKYSATFDANVTKDKQSLRIFLTPSNDGTTATTDLEHVSMFPVDTWKGRENGMRKDLAQALADLHPGVFRFPGGCIIEGTDLNTRYQWKNSVGPVENRPLNENRWNNCFQHRLYPDYFQSYGLGFYEFFQLCEDFGAEALPVISCGLSCQFQNGIRDEATVHASIDSLKPFIDDALDLIEFANGDTTTTWGKVRADMGHPAPFNLKFLAIGNEQWDYKDNPAYSARLKVFLDVMRKEHPEITYIGSVGPDSEGEKFNMLVPKMREMKVEMYDEHYYRSEEWFMDDANRHRYDRYTRKGPKIFAGEYACHGKGKKYNHFNAALMEAAFMTGIERNADLVHMATYAPLFAHAEGWQWRPDMIWYDNLRMMKSCSYYVQQMYSNFRGSRVLNITMDGKIIAGDPDQNGLFASAVTGNDSSELYIKVANTSDMPQPVTLSFKGLKSISAARALTLHADSQTAENTLDAPESIKPTESTLPVGINTVTTTLPAKSFAVIIVKK